MSRGSANAPERIDVGSVLDTIEQRHGTLTPAAVVQEASKISHPLHSHFEWDDRKAAHQHRLNQARALIRSVRVVIKSETTRLTHASYIHDPSLPPGKAGYAKVLRIKTEQDLAMEALESEIDRAAGALNRAYSIAVGLGDNDEAERIHKALGSIGRQ